MCATEVKVGDYGVVGNSRSGVGAGMICSFLTTGAGAMATALSFLIVDVTGTGTGAGFPIRF